MKSFGNWQNTNYLEIIEISFSTQDAAIVFIPSSDAKERKVCAKICLFRGDEWQQFLIQGDRDSRNEWFLRSGMKKEQIRHARLIGSSAIQGTYLKSFLPAFGIEFGKEVLLADLFPSSVHFLPLEGRVRISKTAKKIRVLVVDDSETICKLLKAILSEDPELDFVGSVVHPREVERAVQLLRPDVITMDIHMPEMNGVQLLKYLLPKYSIPVVMISSLAKEDGPMVLDALEAGAIDYILKPAMKDLKEAAPRIREKVRNAASAKVLTAAKSPVLRRPKKLSLSEQEIDYNYLIAIGSSTGGTEALKHVLTSLPEKIPPIMIVQHIPPVFSRAFAERMNLLCPFEVKEAEEGDVIEPSRVLIAPGGMHMGIKNFNGAMRVVIENTEPVNRHKPSVDFLFESIVKLQRKKVVAAILTGMGSDGARGLLKLREQGARTIAQDEASSVVFGMPKEAIKLNAAETISPLSEISYHLLNYAQKTKSAA